MKLIRLFVNNPVAANMLMIMILGGGLVAAFLIPRELFPEFEQNLITISVPYPGASPKDIEEGICWKIEDYVEGIEGIKEVSSTSREGLGVVSLELQEHTNVRKVLDEVKSEVDNLRSKLPDNAEEPVVQEATIRRHVMQVAVYGQAEERTLKEIAQDVKDELTDLPEITQVEVSGVREYEISVEIDEKTLRRLGLTMADVAQRIRQSSFDLPAGRVKTRGGDYSLRIVGQKYTAREYESIPVLYQPDGTVIYLRDVATVREAFEDIDIGGQFNGQPAVVVSVYKVGDEDTIEIARAVREYIYGTQPPSGTIARGLHNVALWMGWIRDKPGKRDQLPAGVSMDAWSDLSRLVSDRLDMLVRNGVQGLLLVVLVLWLFLGWRMSFWVALGIPVSILGTLMVMYMTGQSLNMMSMFALIMALGLIVDDAIVVGENVYTKYQRGDSPPEAAVHGTHQVQFPVLGAVVTTWLAFTPLFFIPGVMGKFIGQLPGVVILTLAFSLLECITILPSHLAHSLAHRLPDAPATPPDWAQRLRNRIDRRIQGFIDGPFLKLFRLATRFRYVTVTIFLGVLLLMAGALKAGYISITTFPKVEGDTIKASLILPTGASIEKTQALARRITSGAREMNEQVKTESGEPVVQQVYSLLGSQSARDGGESGGHVADVIVELLPTERRGREWTSVKLTELWRENVGAIPEAMTLRFGAFRGGPGGKPFEIRVLGKSTADAEQVADALKEKLAGFDGVSDIEDDALPGKMEIQIQPKRKAYALGINMQALASQLRDAFYGNESIEIQRGRDEIKVMVRYPASQRRSLSDLENKRIRTPAGYDVPFAEVADVTLQRGYTTLRRVAGRSVVTVSADIDEKKNNAERILNTLQREKTFEALTAVVPGASIDLRGQRQQRTESLGALFVWFPVALLAIYTVLATIFRSYLQPIIVMVAIPFGLVGAIIGHWLLGFDVTMLSMFGMVALAGIVVNDSLVLLDLVNRRIAAGDSPQDAAQTGARGRFRAIILTTVTTVAGMSPLLAERSFQAQFLKPMAVAISFGLAFATMLTLLVVPCLYLIGHDIKGTNRKAAAAAPRNGE